MEITSCNYQTEIILSRFNKKRKNKLSLFSDASNIFLYFTEYRLTLDMKFDFLFNIKELEIFYVPPKIVK